MSFDSGALKKNLKGLVSLNPKKMLKSATDLDPADFFGTKAAKKAQEKQSVLLEKQQSAADLKNLEATDEIAQRRALATNRNAGRGSLISRSNNLSGSV